MAEYPNPSKPAQLSIIDSPQSNFYTSSGSNYASYVRVKDHYPIFGGFSTVTLTGFKSVISSSYTDTIKGCPRYMGEVGRSSDAWVGSETVKYNDGTSNQWMTAGGFPQFTANTPIMELDKSSDTSTQATAIWTLTYSKTSGILVNKSEGGIQKVSDSYSPSFFKDRVTPRKLIFFAQAGGGMGSTRKLFSQGRGGGAGAFGAFIIDIEKAKTVTIEIGSAGGVYGGTPHLNAKHIKVYLKPYGYLTLVLTLGGGRGGDNEDNGGIWEKVNVGMWGNFCYPVPRLIYSVDSFFIGAHGRLASAGESQYSKTFYSTYHPVARSWSIHNQQTLPGGSGGAQPGGGASFYANGGEPSSAGNLGSGGGGGVAMNQEGGVGGDPIVQVFY